METLRSTFGALADWATRRIVWLRTTVDTTLAGRHDSGGGQGLAEYALILSLIAIAVVGALTFLGREIIALLADTVGTGFQYVLDLIGL